MTDKTNELYIPKPGERVRVVYVSPETRLNPARIAAGAEITVEHAVHHAGQVNVCVWPKGRGCGAWCRVEPIPEPIPEPDADEQPAEETDEQWALRMIAKHSTATGVRPHSTRALWFVCDTVSGSVCLDRTAVARDEALAPAVIAGCGWPMRDATERPIVAVDPGAGSESVTAIVGPESIEVVARRRFCACGVELMGKFAVSGRCRCGECVLADDVWDHPSRAFGHEQQSPVPAPENPHVWESEVATATGDWR